ncbi:hydrogenase maturation protease [Geminocystis herdmanii]|uniref:hydrogenase maturation protease n=1 Tax=Geminocystis herdmanii TaxID=669359 RepID=UPI00034A03B1|nr:hydrogenase maturation protease [Geminocystis herdmanii]
MLSNNIKNNKENDHKCLIIGYGNTLRNDDGVGQIVAKKVEELSLNNVECIYQHQLTPELVEKIKDFYQVFFIDASHDRAAPFHDRTVPLRDRTEVKLIKLPRLNIDNSQDYGHYCNPEYLLYLTNLIYHKNPESFLITIPIENLNLGEELSILAQKGMEKAIEIIKEMILKTE